MESRYAKERRFHDRSFSDNVRRETSRFYAITARSRERFEALVLARCAGKRVLEYGCGDYGYAYAMARHGAAVTAIDLSDVAIGRCREIAQREGVAGRIDFRVMNAEAMEFPDETFDLVVGAGILHHLDLRRALGEIARTLRDDGSALFMEPLGHNPLINLYRRLTPALRTVDEHPLLMADLATARDYFDEVRSESFHLLALGGALLDGTRAFAPVSRLLDRADQLLLRHVAPARRFAWVALIDLGRRR